MADALHPQTLLAHGMNGSELPVRFGGPLRLRLPRQLGYKSVKYLTRLTITDNLKQDRKSTRLNSSHGYISYAVFCLKKKKSTTITVITRSIEYTFLPFTPLAARSVLHPPFVLRARPHLLMPLLCSLSLRPADNTRIP